MILSRLGRLLCYCYGFFMPFFVYLGFPSFDTNIHVVSFVGGSTIYTIIIKDKYLRNRNMSHFEKATMIKTTC